jgi:hypothetical protein
MSRTLATPRSIFALLALTACSTAQPAPKVQSSPGVSVQASSNLAPRDACVATFRRQRACGDVFLPALVDARIRLDRPAGIAAKAQSDGRDALIAQARQEWAQDSTDPAIDATCDRMVGSVPPEAMQRIVEQAQTCLAQSDCGGFVSCILPVIEAQLK